MPRKQAFRVGRSRTGLGLFATAPIKMRAFIVEYKGRKLPTAQAEKVEARGNRYLYEINSRGCVPSVALAGAKRAAPLLTRNVSKQRCCGWRDDADGAL